MNANSLMLLLLMVRKPIAYQGALGAKCTLTPYPYCALVSILTRALKHIHMLTNKHVLFTMLLDESQIKHNIRWYLELMSSDGFMLSSPGKKVSRHVDTSDHPKCLQELRNHLQGKEDFSFVYIGWILSAPFASPHTTASRGTSSPS